jgi:hypothetical protein
MVGLDQLGQRFGLFLSGNSASKKEDQFQSIPEELRPKPAREDLRPKRVKIQGSSQLPEYYNVREAFPYCKAEIFNQ